MEEEAKRKSFDKWILAIEIIGTVVLVVVVIALT